MAAKFQLYGDAKGSHRFSLVGPDGTIMLTSDIYPDHAAAVAGIAAVRGIAASAIIVDRTGSDPLNLYQAKAPLTSTTKKEGTLRAEVASEREEPSSGPYVMTPEGAVT